MRTPKIETERLILRRWRGSDAKDFFSYAKDPRVGPPAGWPPHKSVLKSWWVIQHYRRQSWLWAIQHKETGRVIGCVGLYHDYNRRESMSIHRELGFSMDPNFWGKGLMKEACLAVMECGFREQELEELTLYHLCDNHRCSALAKRLGFRPCYKIHNAMPTWDGRMCDCIANAIKRKNLIGCDDETENQENRK